MGLYNMLFGSNPNYNNLLDALGWSMKDVPRYRDAFISERNGQSVIGIYTRMGGGNRGCWETDSDEIDPKSIIGSPYNGPVREDCVCNGCRAGNVLEKHPLFIEYEDDDYDETYTTFYFKLPENMHVNESDVVTLTPNDMWNTYVAELEGVDNG